MRRSVRVLNCLYFLCLVPWWPLDVISLMGESLRGGQHWVDEVREGHFAKVRVG